MPIIQITLFPGRDAEKKHEIAVAVTRVLQDVAEIPPEATTVLFSEIAPSDWVVAGKPYGSAKT